MSQTQTVAPRKGLSLREINPWSVGAVVICIIVLAPILAVFWMALNPTENIWPHRMSTTLPRYLTNTAILALGVAVLSAASGAGATRPSSMMRCRTRSVTSAADSPRSTRCRARTGRSAGSPARVEAATRR